METEITNIQQLRAKIAFLEIKKTEDEFYINHRIASAKAAISKPFTFIKNTFLSPFFDSTGSHVGADWATRMGRIFLPFLLNSTLLRKRGFLVKSLVSMFSQKVINYSVFNKNILSKWVDEISDFVKSKTKKEKRYGVDNYGIPPESETA